MKQTETPSQYLEKKTEMRNFILKKFVQTWNEQLLKNDFSKFSQVEQRRMKLEIRDKETKLYNSELQLFIASLNEERNTLQKEIYSLKYPDYIRGSSSLNLPSLMEMNSALLFASNLPSNWIHFIRDAFAQGRITFSMQSTEIVLSKIKNTFEENNIELYDEAIQLKNEFEQILGINDKTQIVIGIDKLIEATQGFIKNVQALPETLSFDAFNTEQLEALNLVHPALYQSLRSSKFPKEQFNFMR